MEMSYSEERKESVLRSPAPFTGGGDLGGLGTERVGIEVARTAEVYADSGRYQTDHQGEGESGHSPLSESGRFPPTTDAKKQPLDSSARNSLIYMVFVCDLCGLRACFRERFRREEWLGESG